MTVPLEVSRREVCIAHPLLSALQADTLRALLVSELGERTHELAKEATRLAALTSNPSKDPTGFERAMSALHMYGARVAIEKIDDALVRIDGGGYGSCQECDRPTPFEREPASFGALARDPLALAESRARHPSSARDAEW